MTYPTPLEYDDARLERRDMEYIKSLYPMKVRELLPYVEEECDRMEYAGSMVYDEYPDRLLLHLLCRRVFDKVIRDTNKTEAEEEKMNKDALYDLLQVLVYQELLKRRRDYRRTRSRFY
jgi:hypothetical protein